MGAESIARRRGTTLTGALGSALDQGVVAVQAIPRGTVPASTRQTGANRDRLGITALLTGVCTLSLVILTGCGATERPGGIVTESSASAPVTDSPGDDSKASKSPAPPQPSLDAEESSTQLLAATTTSDFPCEASVEITVMGRWVSAEDRIINTEVGQFGFTCFSQAQWADREPAVSWDVRSMVTTVFYDNGLCDEAKSVIISGHDALLCDYLIDKGGRWVYAGVVIGDKLLWLGGEVYEAADDAAADVMAEMALSAQIATA